MVVVVVVVVVVVAASAFPSLKHGPQFATCSIQIQCLGQQTVDTFKAIPAVLVPSTYWFNGFFLPSEPVHQWKRPALHRRHPPPSPHTHRDQGDDDGGRVG